MSSKYERIIEQVFTNNYKDGLSRIDFTREDLVKACNHLNIPRIKNLGDIVYSFRFRTELPDAISKKAPEGTEWIILGTGIATYAFRLARKSKVSPAVNRQAIKIPDSTPEIVKMYAPASDEQALLTKIRYNRVLDVFTSLTCYSIQNHLRTTIAKVGQIEIDEIYLGLNMNGVHYILTCQAKSPGDQFGIAQIMQDMMFCREKYPELKSKSIGMQFLDDSTFAILEMDIEESDVLKLVVVDEKHYKLVGKDELSPDDLERYKALT